VAGLAVTGDDQLELGSTVGASLGHERDFSGAIGAFLRDGVHFLISRLKTSESKQKRVDASSGSIVFPQALQPATLPIIIARFSLPVM
jgi:hypothetical protein